MAEQSLADRQKRVQHGRRDHLARVVTSSQRVWQGVWFAPMPAANFVVLRVGLGVLSFVWMLSLAPDLQGFFGVDGLEPEPIGGRPVASVFRVAGSDTSLWIVLAVGMCASALLVAGSWTRAAGPVVAIVVTSFLGESWLLWNAGDEVLQTFLVLFALYCVLTPSADLDRPLWTSLRSQDTLDSGRIWLRRLVQVQMTAIYLVAFLEKTAGAPWRDGTAVATVLRLETMARFPVPDVFADDLIVVNLLTWGALVIEAVLPFALWVRASRRAAVIVAIVFHLAIEWALMIGPFSWVMIVGVLSFWDFGRRPSLPDRREFSVSGSRDRRRASSAQ